MALKNLSKGRFRAFLECPLTAWRLRHGEIEAIAKDDYGNRFRAEQGHIVGEIAINWFNTLLTSLNKPHGVNIDTQLEALGIGREHPQWLETAIHLTQQAMANPNVWAIYEATFNTGSYSTRADILARTNQGSWNMIEAKSIMEKREADYIQDMAYTTGVLLGCGVVIHKIGLMRIDSDFILEDTSWLSQPRQLLNLMGVSWKWQEAVVQELARFNTPQANGYNLWQIADYVTSQDTPPPPNWHPTCKDCESCRAALDNDKCQLLLDIPHIGNMLPKFQELTQLQIYCISDIPTGYWDASGSRQRVASIITEAVKRNQVFVGSSLGEALKTTFVSPGEQHGPIHWPALYLDFEYLQTAIPLYEGSHPYEAIPFQYSLHSCRPIGAQVGPGPLFGPDLSTLQHREYLADPSEDGRYLLAQKFLEDINALGGPHSTIFVYNRSAEETCIELLAQHVEERDYKMANELRGLYRRIVDLYAIISRPNFYHPNFHGEFKLKTVIKAVIPDLYAGLDIASGDAALSAYGELAYAYRCPKLSLWEATPEERNKVLEDLRKYCYLDTYSLSVLHQHLVKLSLGCEQCFSDDDIENYRGTFRACPDCLQMLNPKDRGHLLRCSGYKPRQTPWKS